MSWYDQRVPDELVAHTVAMCGDRGRAWLDNLPKRITDLEVKWSIRVFEPFPTIEFNFVAPAVRNESEQVVIKIAPPFENREARSEAKYLRRLDGDGAVKLLAEDRDLEAILLERALPGKNLTEIFDGNGSSCLGPAIDVLTSILRPIPNDTDDILFLDDWIYGLRRSESTHFPDEYSKKALELYDHALRERPNYYLHGDFHPANIVSAKRAPYLAIDPKGIIGPVGYDIAVFLNNYHRWQETRSDVREKLAEAIDRFSKAFEIPELEIRQWAFAQMVLSAWWTFDEMPDMYDGSVAKADVWNI
jgi:streptomycin 6-kinase